MGPSDTVVFVWSSTLHLLMDTGMCIHIHPYMCCIVTVDVPSCTTFIIERMMIGICTIYYSEYSLLCCNWFRRNFGRLMIWRIVLIFFGDVSYHLSCNLYVPHLRWSVSISYVVVGFLFLQSEIYFFCFIVKSILEGFAAILLYTKTTS